MGGPSPPTDGCAQIRTELGAYIVGAISPRDRAVLVRHLESCDHCRDELAGLAALPGLLRRVPMARAAELPDVSAAGCGAPPAELPDVPAAGPGAPRDAPPDGAPAPLPTARPLASRAAIRRPRRRWPP